MAAKLRLLIALAFAPLITVAQTTALDSVKLLIANNRSADALPVARRLVLREPLNPHANYFAGLCLVKDANETVLAIPHLTMAAEYYAKHDLDPGMGEPELVWYYLVLAYGRTGQCNRSQAAFTRFMDVYSMDDDSYPNEARHWMELCYDPDRMKQEMRLLSEVAPTTGPKERQRLVANKRDSLRVVTRDHGYSTTSMLYGVQVGALMSPVFAAQFKGLRNVGVYVDENRVYRYVIGNLIFRSQAEKLLAEVREAGYPDAFIVDITHTTAFQKEVVSIDQQSVNAVLTGPVEFRVQIGAFAEAIPELLAEVYLHVDGIIEYRENGLTMLTVGPFQTYHGAQAERERLRTLGHNDAFVTAFNNGHRIPMRLAMAHTDMDQLTPQKRE